MTDAYQKALDGLYDLQKFGIKLGLNSTQNLLSRLGDPHLALPAVHLAGTNGKGSVGAMLEAALRQAGVKVGFYTSPHLIHFSERFKINGQEITKDRVLDLIERVWQVVDRREPPTFFEFVTAMGFLYFCEEQVELGLIEVGLGGRLDATNLCRPLVSVITNIGLEHTEYLGNTLAQVAFEKAGVIKPGVPLMHGVRQAPARQVVEETARRLGAPVHRLGRELRFRRGPGEEFSLAGRAWDLKHLSTNLLGRHQPTNAALALGAAEVLAARGLPLTPAHFRAGLTRVAWPGRLERWPGEPSEPPLWLDGAHNVPAAKALLESLPGLLAGRKPLVMVVGIMADKPVDEILALLTPAADRVIFSRPVYSRAAAPEVLATRRPADCPPYEIEPDLGRAMERAKLLAGSGGAVIVTGSLFTVGEARAILGGVHTSDLP
ncbi:MAG: bifunctional folylpolyglutamate synthase/dihydrofolate synthase [Deltaproteobacteria bacterium]|nr:bifunctional folylpolyglutamate synthase/dihydrofolate synthase [Deltaproteobacteria bacterium]